MLAARVGNMSNVKIIVGKPLHEAQTEDMPSPPSETPTEDLGTSEAPLPLEFKIRLV